MIDNFKNRFTVPVKISDTEIDSLQQTEYPVTIKFNFAFDQGNDDIIYFNPLMMPVVGENYFKTENRLYPVELPYCNDETFTLNMEIPKGYIVDELPKSVRVNLNDADGSFEYLVGKTATNIQFKFRLK